jgi:hypothetical protein
VDEVADQVGRARHQAGTAHLQGGPPRTQHPASVLDVAQDSRPVQEVLQGDGKRTDWLKNVLDSGTATIVTNGHAYEVDRPEVIPKAEAPPISGQGSPGVLMAGLAQ